MLVKFENKSHRVKGLSFHPKRPWILASLYDGVIQLWDYRVCTLIEKFEGHDGPVRAVSFHHCQPIFVSGGDDYTIKVWNYQECKLLFTLKGHIDFIRTAFFHRENPWIVSASDDSTIKIWNWQARTCISTVTGHSHYVMCAQFHATQPLLLSCSLDQTIRIWDFTANIDVIVKYSTDFERGVNWVSFHQTDSLILAASDDRTVKIFKYSGLIYIYADIGMSEVATLRGHYNNVCCAVFTSRGNTIISASEDKSIRVWDGSRQVFLSTMRRENDRFWMVAVSPNSNVIAAGHDSGFVLFKLHREKPAFDLYKNQVLYIKEKYLKRFDPVQFSDSVIIELKIYRPLSLYYNPIENMMLINYACQSEGADSRFVELCSVPSGLKPSDDIFESKKINAISAVWVSRNRFAALDKNGSVLIKNTKDDSFTSLNIEKVKSIFYAGTGYIIAQVSDKILLVDAKESHIMSTITFPNVRFIHWSTDFSQLALVSPNEILVLTRDFRVLARHTEATKIKSCVFITDNNSILLYTTPYHIKYMLVPWGDHGIVRTLDVVLYVLFAKDQNVACLDRDGKTKIFEIDSTEYMFKLAILENRYDEVLSIIRSSNLVGQALISFVREKDFPEIALHFIKDDKTRFFLSLECLNLPLALDIAKKLDVADYWSKLANIAVKLGEFSIAEECYFRLHDFHSLSLIYVITGNLEKLEKATKSDACFDSKIVSCLYLRNAREFSNALLQHGANSLALATSITHSLPEITQKLVQKVQVDVSSKLSAPPEPFLPIIPAPSNQLTGSWPRLKIAKNIFDILVESTALEAKSADKESGVGMTVPTANDYELWDDELEEFDKDEEKPKDKMKVVPDIDNAWNAGDEDLDLEDEISEVSEEFDVPIESKSLFPSKYFDLRFASLHMIMGSFSTAFNILNKKFGIVEFSPLKSLFMQSYFHTKFMIPSYLSSDHCLFSYPDPVKDGHFQTPFTAEHIQNLIEEGCSLTTSASFVDARLIFLESIHKLLFVIAENKKQLSELVGLLKTCREYLIGLNMEIERRSNKSDQKRVAELAAYFTNCEIRPIHSVLVHKIAMILLYKLKNYRSAYVLAKRLLEMAPSADISQQARKIIVSCEKSGLENEVELNYDEMNPFDMCCFSFTPIYRGEKKLTCSYCSSSYKPDCHDKVCNICQIGLIGGTAPGFTLESTEFLK
ncbi:Coatomer subunit alpha [Thelohanellus kitauei]|uniref:Coatomer subunit alpha n=1 Tax=Thelohanellus kitauei TaxID=669202 RepID=A0A0C2MM53_THEKT|nr:Coatomer subunit alpha [Thelohanellus kitauei]